MRERLFRRISLVIGFEHVKASSPWRSARQVRKRTSEQDRCVYEEQEKSNAAPQDEYIPRCNILQV